MWYSFLARLNYALRNHELAMKDAFAAQAAESQDKF